ncbi:MAG: polysaccharide deacetylase family protein [Actinomycetota bacterium]
MAIVTSVPVGLAALPTATYDPKPPTTVSVSGKLVLLPPQVTLSSAFKQLGGGPQPGRIMSVLGNPLGPADTSPIVRLNGNPTLPSIQLRNGDRLEFQNGADKPEPAVQETYAQAEGNPQFLIGSGSVTVLRGTLSGQIQTLASTPGTGAPQVALTFDDGPSPLYTPAILDILRNAGVKATFFPLGRTASRNPDLVRRLVAEGMHIGNHSWDHPVLTNKPAKFVIDQLKRSEDTLSALGASVSVFRPPFGSFQPSTLKTAESLHLKTVIWSVDSLDWKKTGTEQIVDRVLSLVRPGSIILLHDGGGNRSQTVAALPQIISTLKARGYQFALLGG